MAPKFYLPRLNFYLPRASGQCLMLSPANYFKNGSGPCLHGTQDEVGTLKHNWTEKQWKSRKYSARSMVVLYEWSPMAIVAPKRRCSIPLVMGRRMSSRCVPLDMPVRSFCTMKALVGSGRLLILCR